MSFTRSLAGWVALVSYLVMGALLYGTVLPGADGLWPPDFHLRGYDVSSIGDFVNTISPEGRESYAMILKAWDPIFILSLVVWLIMVGWRGGRLRYVVAALTLLYGVIDFAEDAAIYRFVFVDILNPDMVRAASGLTMAKFASAYLCVLVLIVHIRRAR